MKFLIVRLHHWIPRVKISASVQFQLFISINLWKLFSFDPFFVPGDCDVTNGVKFWNFWNFDFYHCIPPVKISTNAKFQLFISIISEVICFWPFFWSRGIVTSLTGSNFLNFRYLGFITEFLVSKLVQVSNFHFLFQLFVKLFAFDPFFWSRGIVTVTDGVKFWIF